MSLLNELETSLKSEKQQLTRHFEEGSNTGQKLVVTAEAILQSSNLLEGEVSKWCRRDVKGVSKDLDEAKALKVLGGECFQKKEYLQAAEAYSQALQCAPQNNAESRAFTSKLYSNRALCLLKMGEGGNQAIASILMDASYLCLPTASLSKTLLPTFRGAMNSIKHLARSCFCRQTCFLHLAIKFGFTKH